MLFVITKNSKTLLNFQFNCWSMPSFIIGPLQHNFTEMSCVFVLILKFRFIFYSYCPVFEDSHYFFSEEDLCLLIRLTLDSFTKCLFSASFFL